MDLNRTDISTRWIENLALEEINMEESGVVNFNEHLNPIRRLEESSIEFMELLRERFDIYVSRFNELRTGNGSQKAIKMFKISNTVNDFMLFRNSLKLVVARRSEDVINIGFLANNGSPFSARMNYEDKASFKLHEIKAHIGPFNEITWRFQGEILDIDALVRHYLTEFIKHSAQ